MPPPITIIIKRTDITDAWDSSPCNARENMAGQSVEQNIPDNTKTYTATGCLTIMEKRIHIAPAMEKYINCRSGFAFVKKSTSKKTGIKNAK